MGRLNLTALRVRRRALADIDASRPVSRPVWLQVLSDIPPAQALTRQQPIQHAETQVRTKSLPGGGVQQIATTPHRRKPKSAKASRMFAPVEIKYEEDELRRQFFQDHPWELARPRIVLETSGNQHKHSDFSRGVAQPHLQTSGESVIQRQLYLLENTPDITTEEAYDLARREFYALRRAEAVNRRIAKEEAQHMGAQPEQGVLQWGMKVENKHYNDWEKWAETQVVEVMQRSAAFADAPASTAEVSILSEPSPADSQAPTSGSSSSSGSGPDASQPPPRGGPFAFQRAQNNAYNRAPAPR